MARTMADVSLMFRALGGQDPVDPASPPVALREPSLDELRSNRIGVFEDDGLVPVTAETRAAVHAAAAALREAGFTVEPFRPRTLELLRKLWWKFFVQCGAMFYEPEIAGREQQLSPIFQEFLSNCGERPGIDGGGAAASLGGAGSVARKDARGAARVSGVVVPGGKRSGVEARGACVES